MPDLKAETTSIEPAGVNVENLPTEPVGRKWMSYLSEAIDDVDNDLGGESQKNPDKYMLRRSYSMFYQSLVDDRTKLQLASDGARAVGAKLDAVKYVQDNSISMKPGGIRMSFNLGVTKPSENIYAPFPQPSGNIEKDRENMDYREQILKEFRDRRADHLGIPYLTETTMQMLIDRMGLVPWKNNPWKDKGLDVYCHPQDTDSEFDPSGVEVQKYNGIYGPETGMALRLTPKDVVATINEAHHISF